MTTIGYFVNALEVSSKPYETTTKTGERLARTALEFAESQNTLRGHNTILLLPIRLIVAEPISKPLSLRGALLPENALGLPVNLSVTRISAMGL